MRNLDEIVRGCQKYHKAAQKDLYDLFASKMKGICLRYCKSENDAKDVLQDAFIKVFMNIEKYHWKGSFEGWMRRVVTNTALNHIKKNQGHELAESIDDHQKKVEQIQSHESLNNIGNDDFALENIDLSEDQLLSIINNLPISFSTVFNLHCIEEYSHDEIAAIMNISVNTSRTRLARARKMIQTELMRLSNKNMIHATMPHDTLETAKEKDVA